MYIYTDCTQKLLQTDFFARRNFTQNNFYRAYFFSHRCLYAKKMHNSFYRQTVFTHRKFSAQKSYAQKVLRTTFFTYRCFYTQMSLHRHKLHKKLCTQHAFTHSQLLRSSALFPLLDHLPFVFPLSSFGGHRMFFLLSRFVLSGMVIECCGTVFARLVQSVFP